MFFIAEKQLYNSCNIGVILLTLDVLAKSLSPTITLLVSDYDIILEIYKTYFYNFKINESCNSNATP